MKFGLKLVRQRDPSAVRESRQSAGCFGSALLGFGGVIAWAGVHDHGIGSAVSLVGLGLIVAGGAIGVVPWLVPGVDSLRLFAALVTAGLSIACLVLAGFAAADGAWGPLGLLLPVAGLWGLATVMCLESVVRLPLDAGRRTPLLGGTAALLAGLAIAAQANVAGVSAGVPRWVGTLAGLPFLLVGIVILGGALGLLRDGVLQRLLVALLVSALAAVAVGVGGPLGLVLVALSGLPWVAVYRAVHERLWGRDPLAGRGDTTQLGFGCLVGLVLAGLVAFGLRRASQPPPPLEAPPVASPPAP
jgi:hypothetical protein